MIVLGHGSRKRLILTVIMEGLGALRGRGIQSQCKKIQEPG